MTQVVTVSAHTAAYAYEATRKPQRTARKTYVEDNMRAVTNNAAEVEDAWNTTPVNMVQASALDISFLSAHQSRQQATLKEAIEAYEENEG